MTWLHTLLLVAGLAAGYTGGRARPGRHLGDWTNQQLRFHPDRWSSRPRQAALLALLLITHPRRTARAWRKRHCKEPS